jgi:hypothetical protein
MMEKQDFQQTDIFTPEGDWVTDEDGREVGRERLGLVASKYVSFTAW